MKYKFNILGFVVRGETPHIGTTAMVMLQLIGVVLFIVGFALGYVILQASVNAIIDHGRMTFWPTMGILFVLHLLSSHGRE